MGIPNMLLQSMKSWARAGFVRIGRALSLKISIQFHIWTYVLIYIFKAAERKVISKFSNIGGQCIKR